MSSNIQMFPVSGLIEAGVTGSHAFNLAILCGVAGGSVIVPIAVSGNGALIV